MRSFKFSTPRNRPPCCLLLITLKWELKRHKLKSGIYFPVMLNLNCINQTRVCKLAIEPVFIVPAQKQDGELPCQTTSSQNWFLYYLTILFWLQRSHNVESNGKMIMEDEETMIWERWSWITSRHYPGNRIDKQGKPQKKLFIVFQ